MRQIVGRSTADLHSPADSRRELHPLRDYLIVLVLLALILASPLIFDLAVELGIAH